MGEARSPGDNFDPVTSHHQAEAPSLRTPHVTIAFGGDLDERLAALVRAAHEVRTNPRPEADKPER